GNRQAAEEGCSGLDNSSNVVLSLHGYYLHETDILTLAFGRNQSLRRRRPSSQSEGLYQRAFTVTH
ncbi:MAG TPA: hypothetical protein VEP29_08400, partial [Desulfatiglandales bacterium]|nr:hypothetical protein [Desulfatiglandales bacterium]